MVKVIALVAFCAIWTNALVAPMPSPLGHGLGLGLSSHNSNESSHGNGLALGKQAQEVAGGVATAVGGVASAAGGVVGSLVHGFQSFLAGALSGFKPSDTDQEVTLTPEQVSFMCSSFPSQLNGNCAGATANHNVTTSTPVNLTPQQQSFLLENQSNPVFATGF